ncbi:MAG: hypothetical protein R3B45_05090 [Bdellovibrionota bacterium]
MNLRSMLLLLGSSFYASASLAEIVEHNKQDVNIGFEYRSEWEYSDHGLEKTSTDTPTKTSELNTKAANITLNSTFANNGKIDILYSLLDSALGWFIVEIQPFDIITISLGQDFANQGGWDNFNWLYDTMIISPYTQYHLPFSETTHTFEVKFNYMGGFSLQLLDDVIASTGTNTESDLRFNKSNQQPAWILEYTGTFGAVTPLIQYGTYDMNKSNFASIGLNYKNNGIDAYVDYIIDNRTLRAAVDSDTKKKYVHTNIVADLSYSIGAYKPYIKYLKYDVKQPDNDLKGNDPASDLKLFSDNATHLALGLKYELYHSEIVPYFSYIMRSGTFYKSSDASKTETRSDTSMHLGLMGKI